MKEIIGFAAQDRHVTEIVGRFAKKNLNSGMYCKNLSLMEKINGFISCGYAKWNY